MEIISCSSKIGASLTTKLLLASVFVPDLITEDDVVFETGEDDQIESGVDHSDVSAEGVASAEEGPRQPIAH